MKKCYLEDCNIIATYKNVCQKHYIRKKKYGTFSGSKYSEKIDKVNSMLEDFYKDYLNGMTTKTIATKYNVSSATVWKALTCKGIIKTISEQKLGDRNPMWAGANVGYRQLHVWVRSRKYSDGKCEICKSKKELDLANISRTYNKNTYNRELSNWQWLCRSCHMKKDGRIINLKGRSV